MKNCCGLHFRTVGIVVGLFYSTILLITSILGTEYLIEFVSETNLQPPPGLIETTSLILVLSWTGLISSILLISGSLRKRHRFLLPWLLFGIVIILFNCLICLYSIYKLFKRIFNKSCFDYGVLLVVLTTLVLLAFQIYLWKSIQYLYKQMQTEYKELQRRDFMLENTTPMSKI